MNPIEVRLMRNGVVESRHRVDGAFVEEGGARHAGDPRRTAFWRSGMKPFQALPVVESEELERLGLDGSALALACASHHGTREHVSVVRRMLETAGIEESRLACGPHRPLDEKAGRELDEAGRLPDRVHNNCSGKHAAMLILCRARGWDLEGYHLPEHPLQAAIRSTLLDWLDSDPEALAWGVDGCGVPTPSLRLEEMARAYRRFVISDRPAARRIVAAMTAHPMLVSGRTAFSARLMEATGGRILAKEGAEGVLCLGAVAEGWGAAFKVLDGGTRATGPAARAALAGWGLLHDGEAEALSDFDPVVVRNTRDEAVATLEAG